MLRCPSWNCTVHLNMHLFILFSIIFFCFWIHIMHKTFIFSIDFYCAIILILIFTKLKISPVLAFTSMPGFKPEILIPWCGLYTINWNLLITNLHYLDLWYHVKKTCKKILCPQIEWKWTITLYHLLMGIFNLISINIQTLLDSLCQYLMAADSFKIPQIIFYSLHPSFPSGWTLITYFPMVYLRCTISNTLLLTNCESILW